MMHTLKVSLDMIAEGTTEALVFVKGKGNNTSPCHRSLLVVGCDRPYSNHMPGALNCGKMFFKDLFILCM